MWYVEISPSNRATCKICGRKIKKGEFRVALEYNYYNYIYCNYYHPECWLNQHRKVIKDIMRVFLPMLLDDETAKAVLISMEINESGC